MVTSRQQTKWFSSSQLPNHADNTIIKEDNGEQMHFVHPQESVLVIGSEKYCSEYAEQLNQELQSAHENITARLNEKHGTPRAMEAKAAS